MYNNKHLNSRVIKVKPPQSFQIDNLKLIFFFSLKICFVTPFTNLKSFNEY